MTILRKSILGYVVATSVVIIIISLTLFRNEPNVVTDARFMMGTIVEITLTHKDDWRVKVAADAAFQEIERLEAIFSSYRTDSELSRINRDASSGPIKINPEVTHVIEKALYVSEISKGAFDPTIGILRRVWNFSGDDGESVPTKEEIDGLLPFVDFRYIKVNPHESTIEIIKDGVTLDLGGVAKGYIVMKAVEAIKAKGIRRGIVKAGGDMLVFNGTDDAPFRIGIKHPRKAGQLLGEVLVASGAVTTSGDYERYFIKDGIRYHHILDPFTGFPATSTQSVTIVSIDPTLADALSTAIFVMGPQNGIKLLESIPGVEGLIVGINGDMTKSSGFNLATAVGS